VISGLNIARRYGLVAIGGIKSPRVKRDPLFVGFFTGSEGKIESKVSLARFERATHYLEGSRSIQLSYRDVKLASLEFNTVG
jgi:hypothetical protein